MNSFEMTDIDGDALTFIVRDGSTWITCTSGADEVTVGPFPSHLLRRALASEPQPNGQFTTTFLGSSAPSRETREPQEAAPGRHEAASELQDAAPELRLLAPVRELAPVLEEAGSPTVPLARIARREG